MKSIIKNVLPVSIITILISLTTPVIANANTTVMGGPYTNLKSTGQVIHLALSGYPTTAGLYILECVKSPDSSRPTLCNQAAQLWISSSQGASFAPNSDIQFKPTSTFKSGSTDVDCSKLTCGIFIRMDHTAPTDLSEDQFIPLVFNAESVVTLPTDVISASINSITLSASQPFAIKYRDVFKVEATTKSGASVIYASLAPACAISGNEVTVLKGTGFCDIAITSHGNAQLAPLTAHFPLQLNPGIQSVSASTNGKIGSKIKFPNTSNFGEKVSYSATKSANCSLKNNVLTLIKKGACTVRASAPALIDTYSALKQTIIVKIK